MLTDLPSVNDELVELSNFYKPSGEAARLLLLLLLA